MKIAHCTLDGRTGHEAGRALLARLYREETGGELPEIRKAPGGKPYFAEGHLHFSITHTPNHAFCVLSEYNVAIDAEELDRTVNLKLADRILSPAEKAQFENAADPRRALLTFWVLKEAAVKLTGEGMQGLFRKTDFSLSDPRVAEREGCLVAIMEEDH